MENLMTKMALMAISLLLILCSNQVKADTVDNFQVYLNDDQLFNENNQDLTIKLDTLSLFDTFRVNFGGCVLPPVIKFELRDMQGNSILTRSFKSHYAGLLMTLSVNQIVQADNFKINTDYELVCTNCRAKTIRFAIFNSSKIPARMSIKLVGLGALLVFGVLFYFANKLGSYRKNSL
jgi:hypothetical protein